MKWHFFAELRIMSQNVSDRDRRQGESSKGEERGDFKYQANDQESVCPANAHVCVCLFVCACLDSRNEEKFSWSLSPDSVYSNLQECSRTNR